MVMTPTAVSITQTDALGHSTTNTYDTAGDMLTQTDPLGHTTTYTYDGSAGKPRRPMPLGIHDLIHLQPTGRHPHSRPIPAASSPGTPTTRSGASISVTDAYGTPDASTTSYGYDVNGNQTSMTDPLGHATTYTYDSLGREISQTDPLGYMSTTDLRCRGKRDGHHRRQRTHHDVPVRRRQPANQHH